MGVHRALVLVEDLPGSSLDRRRADGRAAAELAGVEAAGAGVDDGPGAGGACPGCRR